MSQTVESLLRRGHSVLGSSLDSEVLLAHQLEVERSALIANPQQEVSPNAVATFTQTLTRRKAGVPVAYLVGSKEFYGRRFALNRKVLVPRPETEDLVSAALGMLNPTDRVYDIGTGSGCVAITIALEHPKATVVASDVDPSAIEVASHNARTLDASNVRFTQADLWPEEVFSQPEAVVVANLPYVPEADYAANPDLRHEPPHALRAGKDGFAIIKKLLMACVTRGWYPKVLLLEIDPSQVPLIRKHAWGPVEVRQDLAGDDRVVILRRA